MFFKTHELNLDPCNQCGNVPTDSDCERQSFDLPQQIFEINPQETFRSRSLKKTKPNQTQETEMLKRGKKDGYMPDSKCTLRLICHSLCFITCRSL